VDMDSPILCSPDHLDSQKTDDTWSTSLASAFFYCSIDLADRHYCSVSRECMQSAIDYLGPLYGM
jgi:hypothetical protein